MWSSCIIRTLTLLDTYKYHGMYLQKNQLTCWAFASHSLLSLFQPTLFRHKEHSENLLQWVSFKTFNLWPFWQIFEIISWFRIILLRRNCSRLWQDPSNTVTTRHFFRPHILVSLQVASWDLFTCCLAWLVRQNENKSQLATCKLTRIRGRTKCLFSVQKKNSSCHLLNFSVCTLSCFHLE